MTKIAIFSDIHGNLEALKAILEDIEKDTFDEVISLGDLIGVGPCSKECLELVKDTNIKMIKGNNEIYQVNKEASNKTFGEEEAKHIEWLHNQLTEEEIKWIEELPMSYEKLIGGKLFTFAHFFINEKKDYYLSTTILGDERIFEASINAETDYMFIGHSHKPFQIINNGVITCVGSSGCRPNDTTFYTILEVDGKNVRIIRKEFYFDFEALKKTLYKQEYPYRYKFEKYLGLKIN